MRTPRIDVSAAQWRKSTYSNQDGGACVEIADGFPGVIPVRDSKNPNGPVLMLTPESFAALVALARADA